MEENNSVEWLESNADLKAIFDTVTNEFGPPDVDLKVGSRIFKVHKKVLEKHSSVLKAKLSDVWRTSGDVLQLDEEYVEPEVIEELLTWLYYRDADKDWEWKCSAENAHSLCIAADYLMISKLVTDCYGELYRQLNPDNFYEIYTFSKNPNLDRLRGNCEYVIVNNPSDYFLSSQMVKWTVEDLKMFIEKSIGVVFNYRKVCETILLSLPLWIDSSEDRSQEFEGLLKLIPPEKLSSDALFRLMETELYSRLNESVQKQYYVRSYLPTGVSSTDILYCVRRTNNFQDTNFVINLYCLDLSANQTWSSFPTERFTYTFEATKNRQSQEVKTTVPIFGVPWRENIYFFGHIVRNTARYRHIKVFSTQTGEWISSEITTPMDYNHQQMLAVAELGDYIFITGSSKLFQPGGSVTRYCLENKQLKTLKKMQTARLSHQLVGLNGLLYAIGSEVLELGLLYSIGNYVDVKCSKKRKIEVNPKPERYDPKTNRWEYISPSNYHHKHPTAVAHEGQIYVLSETGFETYSPETDQWSELPVPVVCHRSSLVSIAGSLWMLTNSVQSPTVYRLVYEFDVVDRKWTRLPDLPEGYYTDFSFVVNQ